MHTLADTRTRTCGDTRHPITKHVCGVDHACAFAVTDSTSSNRKAIGVCRISHCQCQPGKVVLRYRSAGSHVRQRQLHVLIKAADRHGRRQNFKGRLDTSFHNKQQHVTHVALEND